MIKNKTHKLIITATIAATLCIGGSAYFLASANNSFTNNKDVNISSSTSNEAATEITAEEAKNIALEKAGEGYTVKEIELDKDLLKSEYELELRNDTYEIDAEINASTGEVTKWDIKTHDDHKVPLNVNNSTSSEAISSQKEIITESKAKEIALAKAGNGYTVTSLELDRDDNELNYDIELKNGTYEIDAEIDAYTGNILKWEKEKDDDTKKATVEASDNNTSKKTVIGESKAKEIALAKAGNGYTITDIELDRDDNKLDYDIELENGSKEIDAEIDAYTGKILKWEIDTIDDDEDRNDHYDDKPQAPEQGSKKLSVDEVKQIALNKAGSGYKVTDIELDKDHGRLVYELELVNGSYEIDAEVDAYSGEIIE